MHHTPCGFLVPQPGIEPTHAPCIGSTKSTTGSPGSSPQSFDFHLFFMPCSSHMQEHLTFPKTAVELFVCSQIKNFWPYPNRGIFLRGRRWLCSRRLPTGPPGREDALLCCSSPSTGATSVSQNSKGGQTCSTQLWGTGLLSRPSGHVRSRVFTSPGWELQCGGATANPMGIIYATSFSRL